jgi:hypothetical protein
MKCRLFHLPLLDGAPCTSQVNTVLPRQQNIIDVRTAGNNQLQVSAGLQ